MRSTIFLLTILTVAAGCRRDAEWYPPPEQRAPFTGPEAKPVMTRFVKMGDPNAAEYLLKDVSREAEGGAWRWAFQRPELRFLLQDTAELKFVMEFALPEMTFRETGPVTLSIFLNGEPFKKLRFAKPGQLRIQEPVPRSLLKPYAINYVAIEPDKVWVSKEDGAKLSFILSSAGFAK